MQMLSQVLRSVKALHVAGYAHCNIKPSNILRRLKQHDWILSDLACAAPVGAMSVSFWVCHISSITPGCSSFCVETEKVK